MKWWLPLVAVLTASCGQAVPVSGYLARPTAHTILYVHPTVLQEGHPVLVQTLLPRTLGATQCLSLVGPDGLEYELSCGVVEARRVLLHPAGTGRFVVRLDLLIGDRLGARREETVCVVGGDEGACDPTDLPASATAPAVP